MISNFFTVKSKKKQKKYFKKESKKKLLDGIFIGTDLDTWK